MGVVDIVARRLTNMPRAQCGRADSQESVTASATSGPGGSRFGIDPLSEDYIAMKGSARVRLMAAVGELRKSFPARPCKT